MAQARELVVQVLELAVQVQVLVVQARELGRVQEPGRVLELALVQEPALVRVLEPALVLALVVAAHLTLPLIHYARSVLFQFVNVITDLVDVLDQPHHQYVVLLHPKLSLDVSSDGNLLVFGVLILHLHYVRIPRQLNKDNVSLKLIL